VPPVPLDCLQLAIFQSVSCSIWMVSRSRVRTRFCSTCAQFCRGTRPGSSPSREFSQGSSPSSPRRRYVLSLHGPCPDPYATAFFSFPMRYSYWLSEVGSHLQLLENWIPKCAPQTTDATEVLNWYRCNHGALCWSICSSCPRAFTKSSLCMCYFHDSCYFFLSRRTRTC